MPTSIIPAAHHPWRACPARGFAAAAGAEPQAAAPRPQPGRQRGGAAQHSQHQQQQQQQQARPNVGLQQRLGRLTAILQCEPAAAEALAREHPILLLLGPYALRRLAAPSLESVVAGGHPGGAWAGGSSSSGAAAAAGAAAGARLLFEAVVDAPSSLQFRAMHWGMRLHIGQLAAHCHDLGLAVDAGKDFAVVWLGPRLQQRVVRRPPLPPPHRHEKQQRQQRGGAGSSSSSSSSGTAAAAAEQRAATDTAAHGGGGGGFATAAAAGAGAAAPFLLVAYRHGAVVLLGPPSAEPGEGDFEMPAADAAALSRAIPLGAFYRTGLPMAPRHAGPSLAQPLAADFHNVRVDPSAEEPAALGLNEAILRVLDVGHLRVVSSILGQSVALAQVDREMDNALTSLHAAMAGAKGGRGVGIFSGPRDSRLFKAAAFGSMAITEAHNLLDAGELSWRYDAFSQAWELMAEEYCLATRFQSLQLKLDEYKQTATFDLKQSHGRRYAKLTDRVILLLLISCLIALIELALPQQADKNGGWRGSSGRGSGDGRCGTGCV